jgi:cytidine deaminase
MRLDQNLVDTAIAFVNQRFPTEPWAGAAAMYSADGKMLISTAPECVNESVGLCHEIGAICEAHKLNQKVTASVCVSRDEQGRFHILTPCGVCQERLYVWGGEVEVAVPAENDSTQCVP